MTRLVRVSVQVPEAALETWEAALAQDARAVDFFREADDGDWTVSAVRDPADDATLADALLLARATTGLSPQVMRQPILPADWLAETARAFPEQRVGRFLLRGTHLSAQAPAGTILLRLDAGMAFGSGEHGSTRGCLRAIALLARRRRAPQRILDLGTGSGVLAMAAARIWRRPVLATDIEARAVGTTVENALRNGLRKLVRARRADGWRARPVRQGRPYDLVLANILARPLSAMAVSLCVGLAPGGRAVLAGLLDRQARKVLAAHRRHGVVLRARISEGAWTTLVLARIGQERA